MDEDEKAYKLVDGKWVEVDVEPEDPVDHESAFRRAELEEQKQACCWDRSQCCEHRFLKHCPGCDLCGSIRR